MAVLFDKIPVIPQPAIASYDFTSLITNSGYLEFYLISPTGGKGISVTSSFTGFNMYVENDTTTSSFDLLLESPLYAKGTAYVQLAIDPSFNNTQISCALYRVRDGGETEIGTSSAYNIASAATKEHHAFRIALTELQMTKGDTLRFKVTSNQNNTYILCDPTNSDVATPNGTRTKTQSKFLLQVRADIS